MATRRAGSPHTPANAPVTLRTCKVNPYFRQYVCYLINLSPAEKAKTATNKMEASAPRRAGHPQSASSAHHTAKTRRLRGKERTHISQPHTLRHQSLRFSNGIISRMSCLRIRARDQGEKPSRIPGAHTASHWNPSRISLRSVPHPTGILPASH